MGFRPLSVACPTCGSRDVFYTCTPNCCFNHVCDGCRTTFELVTEAAGGTVPVAERAGIAGTSPADTTMPHASCVACGSLAVQMAEPDPGPGSAGPAIEAACGACFARLTLRLENVAPPA